MINRNSFNLRYKGTESYYKPERLCKICDAHMGFSRYVLQGDRAYCRSCRGKRTELEKILTPGNCGSCDGEVYSGGKYIGILTGGSAKLIERFIQLVNRKTGLKTDWSYVAGRAVVKTLGEPQHVCAAIEKELKSVIFANEPCKYNKLLTWSDRSK